jgi:peptidyl-tRNA hydrolase, PTH1 family
VQPAISLIAGLGNPGPEYAETRHNAGFRFLDAVLAAFPGARMRAEAKFYGEVGQIDVGGNKVWLLKPMTYMNHSGEAVAKLANFYKLLPAQVLVVHDELDLLPGTARLKIGGGDGGHNGLSDVTEKLGSPDYARLRVGIGHPGSAPQVVSYVLKRAPLNEQQLIDGAIERALGLLSDIVHGQHQKVMNLLHSHKGQA